MYKDDESLSTDKLQVLYHWTYGTLLSYFCYIAILLYHYRITIISLSYHYYMNIRSLLHYYYITNYYISLSLVYVIPFLVPGYQLSCLNSATARPLPKRLMPKSRKQQTAWKVSNNKSAPWRSWLKWLKWLECHDSYESFLWFLMMGLKWFRYKVMVGYGLIMMLSWWLCEVLDVLLECQPEISLSWSEDFSDRTEFQVF